MNKNIKSGLELIHKHPISQPYINLTLIYLPLML